MQERLSNTSCQCELCAKAKQINAIRKQRRDLSLGSIYRKDYRAGSEGILLQPLPPTSARKNESTNFKDRGHSYLEISSTYLANYQLQPEHNHPRHSPRKTPHIRLQNMLQNYVSTYSNAHRKLPVLPQESYKIADPEVFSSNRPFPKQTQYSKNYLPIQSNRQSQNRHRNHSFQYNGLKLFETTHKQDYSKKTLVQERVEGPADNMVTLPTSSFLYNTTYKQEYNKQFPANVNTQADQHCFIDKYRF